MKIDWLKPLLGHDGPFATVVLDMTRGGESGEREIENRWRSVRRRLAGDGASDALLDAIEDVALRSTHVHGPHGRVLVANGDGVLVDRLVRTPPAVQQATFGPVPVLLPAARAADESVSRVLVVVDRQGADISWVVAGGTEIGSVSVDGDHDEVSKAQAGRLQQRRVEARAEDSWERNAEAVASEVSRVVGELAPEVVLMTGDVHAVRLVRGALTKPAADLLLEISGGARGNGVNQGALDAQVAEALDVVRTRRRDGVLDALRAGQGRDDGGVTSIEDVVAVLQRGQVSALVVTESFVAAQEQDPRPLWVGGSPLQIATTREGVVELGGSADEVEEYPAGVAMVRAALGQDAGLTYAPDGTAELADGVGAVLRWADEGTPHESAPSMSTDKERLREGV